jgi:gamma-glutamylcyclotransferase (GGCT)/AIG2-like uncharacterized protein YtfP
VSSGKEYLFVYGTLRPGCGHPMAAFLAQRGHLLGRASVSGRLYNLGWYPGLLPPALPGDIVQGDLYELTVAECTLAELDRYEIDASALFERGSASVVRGSGEQVSAWLYYYRGEVRESQRITSGDFLNG